MTERLGGWESVLHLNSTWPQNSIFVKDKYSCIKRAAQMDGYQWAGRINLCASMQLCSCGKLRTSEDGNLASCDDGEKKWVDDSATVRNIKINGQLLSGVLIIPGFHSCLKWQKFQSWHAGRTRTTLHQNELGHRGVEFWLLVMMLLAQDWHYVPYVTVVYILGSLVQIMISQE